MKDLKGKITLKTFPVEDKTWIKLKKESHTRGIKLYVFIKQMLELGLENVGK